MGLMCDRGCGTGHQTARFRHCLGAEFLAVLGVRVRVRVRVRVS